MSGRLEALLKFVQQALIEPVGRLAGATAAAVRALFAIAVRRRRRLVIAALLALLTYGIYAHPPFAAVRRGEVLVRTNVFDGSASVYTAGAVLVLPAIHQVRRYSTRDQVYRPIESASATGAAPFQSVEGLSLGIDLGVRWSVEPARLAQMSKEFPDDINADLVHPAVEGVIFPLFARYSVREIFSSRRAEIQQELMTELKPKLATLGLLLRGVDMGNVDLPRDYRAGMEKLLAEELETEKVGYMLTLKEAQVKQMQLEAEADKARRNHLLDARRFGRRLPPRLVGLGLKLHLFHLRFLERQQVAYLLGLELLREELLHSRAIVSRQIDLPHIDSAQQKPEEREPGPQLG